jgi:hypothetical protein
MLMGEPEMLIEVTSHFAHDQGDAETSGSGCNGVKFSPFSTTDILLDLYT